MKASLPLKVVLNRVGEATLEEYGASQTALDTPQAIFNFWQTVVIPKPEYEAEKENLIVILLNTKLRPKGYHLVALGSLNECVAHPREIFRPVIVSSAYGFVLSHNHPSGDPSPSSADRQLTAKLREGAALLQISFLDHVVIGAIDPSRLPFFSFRDAGLL